MLTPEQQRDYEERKQKEKECAQRKHDNGILGKFFFTSAEESFEGISPESVTRLIYLNTFVGYDDNKVMITLSTPMKRKDLPEVLGVSKATVSRFWKEVSPKYLTENDKGLLFTSKDIFARGKINNAKHKRYQKIYFEGIRKLYQSTERRNHRRLGYIFKLLPFINIEYNLICRPNDIYETDLDKISLISILDFCKLIGFDVKHLNDLVDAYRNIRFTVNGKQERFCALTYEGINKATARIFVNPHILYSGSDYEKVKVLAKFC